MRKRSWIGLAAALRVAFLHHNRDSFEQVRANVRAFDLPTAGAYDALVASLLGGLYERVGDEVATSLPTGTVLEVGSGLGRLAVLLTQRAPDLSVTGVDISPEMVEHAARRAAGAGLGERARFKVGNVGALPFLKAASTERSAPSPCTTGRIRFGAYPRYIGS
jgi:ubiquinone/menaquinone biosynthesis C-methylase UbiE